MQHPAHNPKSDLLGIISSSLCLIHCLAGPILVLLGYSFIEPDHWPIWDILFLGISVWAVYFATRGHAPRHVKLGLWFSVLLLSVSIIFSHDYPFFSVLSWIAAASLVLFHVLNIRHGRSCPVKVVN